MKSMEQMQAEMLSKARFDGGYPKPVIMGMGVLALAKDEEEYKRLTRESEIAHLVFAIGLVMVLVVFLGAVMWKTWFA